MVKILGARSDGRRHPWSDWAGFIFFAFLSTAIFRRSSMLAIMMLPVFLHDMATSIAFLVRRPANARLAGWGPRIAAYGGTLLMPVFLVLVGPWRPSWVALTPLKWAVSLGYCVWLAGMVLAIWTVWHLRHSFSLEPQARELVTTGPYRLARHPIYAAYVLEYLGMWLGHLTVPFGVILLAWLSLIAARIHYEETVLEKTFPQYAEYRQKVGMFGPKLRPNANPSAEPAPSAETVAGGILGSSLGDRPRLIAATAQKATRLENC